MTQYYTPQTKFYGGTDPKALLEQYGSPLYVYNESILRQRCREMAALCDYPHFKANYSVKANTNLHLLKIVREEGILVDAVSPGEVYLCRQAGFAGDEILFVGNNLSVDELRFCVEQGAQISIDSLDQLEVFGQNFPGAKVSIRMNTGYGAGHHEHVVTAGKKTKFGINDDNAQEVLALAGKYNLTINGLNQHIGSLFMEESAYVASAEALARAAMHFPALEFIDLGGGFGVPYRKQDGERRLDLDIMRARLNDAVERFIQAYGREITVKSEPGRYIMAECGVLLGQVNAIKENNEITYVGTDIGFNVLQRPVLYGSHHDIEVYREGQLSDEGRQTVTIVGNICETGDKLAQDRTLPFIRRGDILGVMDAGAYGYSMASSYNSRLLPAEVLIDAQGHDRLIRRRQTMEDLMARF